MHCRPSAAGTDSPPNLPRNPEPAVPRAHRAYWGALRSILDTAPRLIELVVPAAEQGDAQSVAYSAHTLGSSSAFPGARHLPALCRELGVMGRACSVERAPTKVACAKAELERVRQALLRELDKAG